MSKNIATELEAAVMELSQLISSLSQQQLNTVPFEGSWTAGQLAEHLLLSYNGVLEMVKGKTEPTGRQPDKFVAQIKADFLDFSTKMTSPDFIEPRSMAYDKEALLASLSRTRAKLLQAIATLDPSITCTLFAFPVYGYLTRLELYYFMLYHTQRHLHQLRGIVDAVMKSYSSN